MADGLARSQQYAVLTALIEAKRRWGRGDRRRRRDGGLQQGSGFLS